MNVNPKLIKYYELLNELNDKLDTKQITLREFRESYQLLLLTEYGEIHNSSTEQDFINYNIYYEKLINDCNNMCNTCQAHSI